MESSLVSWQYENFSSAELVSPPVSPSPPSPSLYNGTLSPSGKYSTDAKNVQSPEAAARAQMASSILNDLEQLHGSTKIEMNDFGENWNEESINLGLFEELAEIEYTPPASPKKTNTQKAVQEHQLNEHSIPLTNFIVTHQDEALISETPADLSALAAEFQEILESLPKESTVDGLKVVGIPTTIIDGEAMVPFEFDLTNITNAEMQIFNIDDVNVNVINDMEIIDESEIFGLQSPAASIHSVGGESYVLGGDEIVDHHSHTATQILDALLQGDVTTAESFLPSIMNEDDESMSSMDSQESDAYIEDVTSPQPSTSRVEEEVRKPERRGRKPGKKLPKGSLAYIKDKSLRKKEQNKTAATRYRQKKKVEVELILDSEAQLQKEHDDLTKSKEDLHRQILMVKQLLREVIQARKPSVSQQGKIIVPGGRVTVSSVLARNRRK